MDKWYSDYEQFLLIHDLYDRPDQIWNADKSGFPLCPKSGKILAPKGEKHVYHVTGSSKQQITTLVCIKAAGSTIPPMHIFPGVRYSYNPMEGCVDRAYFGKSDSRPRLLFRVSHKPFCEIHYSKPSSMLSCGWPFLPH